MKSVVIGFSILITCLLLLFQLAKVSHWQAPGAAEWWMIFFSLLFLVIGIFISRSFSTGQKETNRDLPEVESPDAISGKEEATQPVVTTNESVPDVMPATGFDIYKELAKLGITVREYEVLQLVRDGLSNQQIAERLFVSENTIKKHISSLFFKLDVQRRTEAVKKAIDLQLLS